jgi:hypothetical protein
MQNCRLSGGIVGSYRTDHVEARKRSMLNRVVIVAVLTAVLAAAGASGARAQQTNGLEPTGRWAVRVDLRPGPLSVVREHQHGPEL